MSSSRLGLRAHELLSARTMGPGRIAPLSSSKLCRPQANGLPTSQSRPQSTIARTSLEKARSDLMRQSSPKAEMSRKMKNNLHEVAEGALSMVVPGTFVLPPLSQLPKPLGQKFRLVSQWLLMKGQEAIANAATKFSSKPSIFTKALYRPKRSVLIPTAKALHRSMAAALAAGDRDTINNVCSRKLADSLLTSIDARPKGRHYGWELVAYTNKLFYPSIKSHRLSPLSRDRAGPIVRQAVVAISSKQRRVQYDAQGQVIPGTEKEMEVVEHVAMSCLIDGRTWKQGEWRIVGTIKPTSLEGWMKEKALLKRVLQES